MIVKAHGCESQGVAYTAGAKECEQVVRRWSWKGLWWILRMDEYAARVFYIAVRAFLGSPGSTRIVKPRPYEEISMQ